MLYLLLSDRWATKVFFKIWYKNFLKIQNVINVFLWKKEPMLSRDWKKSTLLTPPNIQFEFPSIAQCGLETGHMYSFKNFGIKNDLVRTSYSAPHWAPLEVSTVSIKEYHVFKFERMESADGFYHYQNFYKNQ